MSVNVVSNAPQVSIVQQSTAASFSQSGTPQVDIAQASIEVNLTGGLQGPAGPQGATGTPLAIVSIPNGASPTAANDTQRYNNTGATQPSIVTLPPSATLTPGWTIFLRVTEAQAFTVVTQGADTIFYDALSVASLSSSEVGAALAIEYQGSGNFLVPAWSRTWG